MNEGGSRAAKRRKKEQNKAHRQSTSSLDTESRGGEEELVLFQSESPQVAADFSSIPITTEGILSILERKEVVEISSEERAVRLMRALISPMERSEFYSSYWQRVPLAMSSSDKKTIFEGLLENEQINEILARHALHYPQDLLLGRYQNGVQSFFSRKKTKELVTELPEDSLFLSSDEILKALEQGYSLRLSHPQKYDDTLWRFLSALEHEFNTPLSCEATVSPISVRSLSQGFAPSLTQGDVFIVQIEGAECWTIYGPPTESKSSSSDHSSKPMAEFPPATDSNLFVTDRSSLASLSCQKFTLEPGYCLYVPSGHLAESSIAPSAATHSASKRCIHLTLSCNHASNIVKVLNLIVPQALFLLERQGLEELRRSKPGDAAPLSTAALASRSLPAGFLNFMGVQNSADEDALDPGPEIGVSKKRALAESFPKQREQFRSLCRKTFLATMDHALEMLDPAADQVLSSPSS
jgi:hypothetical protein